MRVARLHLFVGLLLLTECGAQQDLVIGISALAEAGASSGSGGSAGDATAGGATNVAGAGGTSGMMNDAGQAAGGDAAGAPGAGGEGGESTLEPEQCTVGELPPVGSLIHRYSFEETSGKVVVDSMGSLNGELSAAAAFDGSGSLELNANGQFVDLPNRIVHDLPDLTVVAWTTWKGVPAWERVFDFGTSIGGENQRNGGRSYICMMTKTGFFNQTKPGLGGEIKVPGFDTVTLASTEDMTMRSAQVAFSFKSGERASIYINGVRLATQATAIKLSDIDDVNNWIGRSQYDANQDYEGSFDEFRIYDAALNGCQLGTLLFRGKDMP